MLHPQLAHMLASGQFSDVVVTVGQDSNVKSYSLHRVLICSFSEFFAKACGGPFQEAETGVVQLPEDDPRVFERFISFVYLGHLEGLDPSQNVGDGGNDHVQAASSRAKTGSQVSRPKQGPDGSSLGKRMLIMCRIYHLADKLLVPELKVVALSRLDRTIREILEAINEWGWCGRTNLSAYMEAIDEVFAGSAAPTVFLDLAERMCHFVHRVAAHAPAVWLDVLPAALQRHRELLLGTLAYAQPPLILRSDCAILLHCTRAEHRVLCRCCDCMCLAPITSLHLRGWNDLEETSRRRLWIEQQQARIALETRASVGQNHPHAEKSDLKNADAV